MKLHLWKQKITKTALSIAAATALIALGTVSCTQNRELLVTEIGISPPKRPVSKPSKAMEFYIQGQYKYIRGDSQGAIAAFSQSINLNPNYAPAYNSRGLVYFDIAEKQQAIANYSQAIRLNPNNSEYYKNCGNARAALGDKQRAIADSKQTAKIFQQQNNELLYQQVMKNMKQLQ